MELANVIIGTRLNEIQKKADDVKLVFHNTKTNKVYVLTFKGLLFETSAPTLNKRVKNVQLNEHLGFRATSQLKYLKRNPDNYRQLFIQMEGSDNNNKFELLGAMSNFKVSPRRQASVASKPLIKKKAARRKSA
jgi:hypothetical protein